MDNLTRRIIANLSIPRNPQDLQLTLNQDPFSGLQHQANQNGGDPQKTLHQALDSLAHDNLIAKIQEQPTPGELAALVTQDSDHPEAPKAMPDEKAQNYEQRLKVPSRSWRAKGEQYIMTNAGFDTLHDPTQIGDPTPLPTYLVEQAIRAEHSRVLKTDPENFSDPNYQETLGDKLLEDEFTTWAAAVADKHDKLTGERPQLPIAGGAGYSDATELLIIDPENGKGSPYTETAPWFMAAVTVAITDADTGSTITEANYTGYARKSVAAADMASASAGSAANVNAITFAACTGGTSAVIGFGKCAALTVGRLIKFGTCTLVNVSSTQTPLNFAVGAFATTLD